jgi:hypothetical protein
VFPVRYGQDLYILFRRNSVFKGLKQVVHIVTSMIYRVDIYCNVYGYKLRLTLRNFHLA